jgi:hypothetical protein
MSVATSDHGERELVERYLQAVRCLLPKQQRDDVGRELGEDLRAQIEDRESALGRALHEDELTDLLRGFGHPAVLALRYRQGRHLIGPELFPLFWFCVKSVLGVLAVVHLLAPGAYFVATGEPSARVIDLFIRFPGVAMPVLAWLTLAFAILDTRVVRSAVERALAGWTPRSLPEVRTHDEATRPPSPAGLAVTAVLGAWWLAGLAHPPLLLGPAADYVGFGPAFERMLLPIALASAASLAVGWIRLSGRGGARFLAVSGLAVDALGLAVLYFVARGGTFVVAREALLARPDHERLLAAINSGVGVSLAITLALGAAALAWNAAKHLRTR